MLRSVLVAAAAISLAGCVTVYEGSGPNVRLYNGLGGEMFGQALHRVARDANEQCKANVVVASRHGLDNVPAGRRTVIGGASMGGQKAVLVAESLGNRKVQLLLTIDPIPWVNPVPKNVERHVNWRGTIPGQLGRGRPKGTHIDVPIAKSHLRVIGDPAVRERAVKEICRLAK